MFSPGTSRRWALIERRRKSKRYPLRRDRRVQKKEDPEVYFHGFFWSHLRAAGSSL
jgi:hypothetical protein